jgi:inner membrane transporter RhtA
MAAPPPTAERATGVDRAAVPVLLVLVAMASVQGGASLAKQLFPAVGAAGTSALRLLLATMILAAVWRPWRARGITRAEWRTLALYGASLGGMNLTFYLALERLPLGVAVAIEFTGPLAVAVLASRRAVDLLWAALAAVGIVLVLPFVPGAADLDPLGVVWALIAGACWGVYILQGKRAGATLHAGTATAIGMAIASLVAIPFGVASAGARLLDLAILPLALAVALLSSAIPYSLEMIGLKRLPPHTFGVLMSLEPALAALSGRLFLAERLTVTQWAAIACVMVASAGSTLSARRPRPVA